MKGYLLTIARHLYLERRRRASRQTGLSGDRADPHPGPDRIHEGRQDLARVLDALQELPEVDRAALIMRVEEELPYEEIGRSLRLSVSAVKVKVHRARRRLAAARVRHEEVIP